MVKIFFSYAHEDEALRDQIETQLAVLKRQGVVETWHDRRIAAGSEWASEIDDHIESDDVILLLVSPDFLDSDYCYEKEMKRALERHDAGEAVVIPVILRPCDWTHAPFGKLNATPNDGKPVTRHTDRDEAMLEVATAIRKAAEKFERPMPSVTSSFPGLAPSETITAKSPRSSNLSVAKSFSKKDLDEFELAGFEYMQRYFEASLAELQSRNEGIETRFRVLDADRFSAVIYKGGEPVSRCTICLRSGDSYSSGIAYTSTEDRLSNSYQSLLKVESDDQSIYFSADRFGMGYASDQRKLTFEGAAETYWSKLIGPLQPNR